VPEEEIELPASDEKGWLGKIKESIYQNWQTILVALIVLIVGISAYNYNEKTGTDSSAMINQEENAEEANAEESNTEETATAENQEENAEEADQKASQPENQENAAQAETNTEQQTGETKTQEINTNTVESNDNGYKVTTEKGEGITHLARKALAKYLSENRDDEVTALHKIYIEDYLQNRIGNQGIEVGHVETFSKASIQEAIAASKKLSQASLDNLKKYSVQ